MSSNGQCYTAADQGRIENKGQQFLQVMTNEGRQGLTCCQIGEVNRPLMAVSQVADAGNVVLMDWNGGGVYSLHDESWILVRRQNNVYEMDLWLTSNDANGKVPEASKPIDDMVYAMIETFKDVLKRSGFTRPGL